jgi:signal transduction histidine kinase
MSQLEEILDRWLPGVRFAAPAESPGETRSSGFEEPPQRTTDPGGGAAGAPFPHGIPDMSRAGGPSRDFSPGETLEDPADPSQALQAVGALAGGLAHDLNNLLLPVMAYGSMVLEELPEGSKARRRQAAILASARKAQELIAQLGHIGRPDGEQRGPLNAGPLVKEATKRFGTALAPRIEVEQSVDPDTPMIWAEPVPVHRVLLSLLNAAVHATGQGQGSIRVELGAAPEPLPDMVGARLRPGGAVCLSVSCHAEGVPEQIFQPVPGTRASSGGSGRHLAPAHHLIDHLRGAITVESAPRGGTVYRVYLPAVEPSSAAGG